MGGYDIKFNDKNPNALEFRKDGRLCHCIAIPPIDKGCDILTIKSETLENKFKRKPDIRDTYTYDFQGFIIITTEEERSLYCKGELICKTNR